MVQKLASSIPYPTKKRGKTSHGAGCGAWLTGGGGGSLAATRRADSCAEHRPSRCRAHAGRGGNACRCAPVLPLGSLQGGATRSRDPRGIGDRGGRRVARSGLRQHLAADIKKSRLVTPDFFFDCFGATLYTRAYSQVEAMNNIPRVAPPRPRGRPPSHSWQRARIGGAGENWVGGH